MKLILLFLGFTSMVATSQAQDLIERRPLTETVGSVSFNSTLFTKLDPRATRINYVHKIATLHPDKRLFHSSFACGAVALGDLNQDGLTDVFITGGPDDNRLYVQSENLSFVDISPGLGIDGAGKWAGGAVMIDIDNDHDLDLYVCFYDQPNQLFINQLSQSGKLAFREESAKYGLNIKDASLVPAFADYDLDGDLDLYLLTHQLHRKGGRPATPVQLVEDGRTGKLMVKGELSRYYRVEDEPDEEGLYRYTEWGRPDALFRNDDGVFVEVTADAGISTDNHYGNSASWWDFNYDGLPDLHVGNDFLDPDFLYRNNGDGTFTDVAEDVLPQTTWFSMGSALLDANLDGLNDMVVADMFPTTHYKQKANMASMGSLTERLLNVNGARQLMRNALFMSTGTSQFIEGAYLAGIGQTDWTWSIKSGDYDQDGFQDLYFNNGVARNFNHSDLPALNHDALVGRSHWDIYENTAGEKKEQNLAYRHNGKLGFEDVSKEWGLDLVGMSHTCSQADLDNDGDLDLVVCSLNEPVYIYRNDGASGNSIKVKLKGTTSNSQGIGAKIYAETGDHRQVREIQTAWGFMDADECIAHFGIGNFSTVRKLEVRWPSGIVQTFDKLKANALYVITEPSTSSPAPERGPEAIPLFVANNGLKEYPNREDPFDDFAVQPLLPFQLSQFGPSQAWGDVDDDGKPDLYLGGGNGAPGRLIYNKTSPGSDPKFSPWVQKIFEGYQHHEDSGAVFLDFDSDGDLDLYVASGGVEHEEGSDALQDRLYMNKGNGNFSDAGTMVPKIRKNSSCVTAADFDQDGDVDLFVGTRSKVGSYPVPVSGHLLINKGGKFWDETEEICPDLVDSGMITSAVWSDITRNGWLDLVVAYDWGPIRVYPNQEGRLGPPMANGIENILGWWNSVGAADLDRDGDMDLVAGNMGLNSQYKASIQSPELIFYGDFEGNGQPHIVEANFENGVCYPRRGFSCSSQAMPFLKPQLETYHNFASASLTQIYQIDQIKQSVLVKANELRSGAFYNDGSGNFNFVPFPKIAQIAPVFGISVSDFNMDGYEDCYLGQNFYSPQVETGPIRGGIGQLLLGRADASSQKELLSAVSWDEAGIAEPGDSKSVAVLDINQDNRLDLVVTLNNSAPSIFLNNGPSDAALAISLAGKPGNPGAIGAKVEVEIAGMPRQIKEVQNGSGFLSAVHDKLLFARPPEVRDQPILVRIRWPEGEEQELSYGPEVTDLAIAFPTEDPEPVE